MYPVCVVHLLNKALQPMPAIKLEVDLDPVMNAQYDGWMTTFEAFSRVVKQRVTFKLMAWDHDDGCWHGNNDGWARPGRFHYRFFANPPIIGYNRDVDLEPDVREGLVTGDDEVELTFDQEWASHEMHLMVLGFDCQECVFHVPEIELTHNVDYVVFNPQYIKEAGEDGVLEWQDYVHYQGRVYHRTEPQAQEALQLAKEHPVAFRLGETPVYAMD